MRLKSVKQFTEKAIAAGAVSALSAGFLFAALPVSAETAQVMISSTVRNLNQGGPSYWSKTISADLNDRLEFNIQVRSTGISTLYNVRVSIELPWGLRYVNGTTRIGGLQAAEGIVSYPGLNLENLASGESRTIYLQADVLDGSYFSGGSAVLTSYAGVRADNLLNTYQDKVEIQVGGVVAGASTGPGSGNYSATYSDYYYPILYLEALGANVSRGDLNYTETIYAAPGEIVEFALRAESRPYSLGTISGVWVSDRLPPELSYINNSTTIEGAAAADGITNGGIEVGTLTPGQVKTVKFRARIFSRNLAKGEVIAVADYAWARAAGAQTMEASAAINISQGKYSAPVASGASGAGASDSGGSASNGAASNPSNLNGGSNGEVLGAATVKTGPAGTVILVTLASLFASLLIYYRLRRDRILLFFPFWEDWRLKRTLYRLKDEKIE